MASTFSALKRHQADYQAAGVLAGLARDGEVGEKGEGGGSVVEELQELLERMAGTAVGAQKDHPIGFKR